MEAMGNCSDEDSGDDGCQDGCPYCCCCCCSSTSCGGLADHSDGSNFSAQMAAVKEIWDEWSEVQQVLALFSLLRSGNSLNSTAHLMVAGMLYAHHSNEETFQLYQEANDPVWVARMEMKCIEDAGLEIDYEDCDRSDSDRRESASSGERRESTASSYRRESAASSSCRRESASSWDRRESAASSCRRESEGCDERLEVDTREWRRESRSEEITEETEDLDPKDGGVASGSAAACGRTRSDTCGAKLTPDFGSRRESEVSGEERRESNCSSIDRRESLGSNHSCFEERRGSADSFLYRRTRLGNYKQDPPPSWRLEHCEACGAVEHCMTDEKLECFAESSFSETIDELLLHLPLLHINNSDAKRVYLAVIERAVCIGVRLSSTAAGSSWCSISQKLCQLTTLALLHPAVTSSERKRLMACLQSLRDAPSREAPEGSDKGVPGETELPMEGGRENVTGPPLVKDIGIWLKSLRLHKYDWLVAGLDYHQLLALDDETLEAKGVTKGARHKLLQSIARLGLRHEHLNTIEKELQRGGVFGVEAAIAQLKTLVITPMPPPPPLPATADAEDLPASPMASECSGGPPAQGGHAHLAPGVHAPAHPVGHSTVASALHLTSTGHPAIPVGSHPVTGRNVEMDTSKSLGASSEGAANQEHAPNVTENEDLPTHFTKVLGKVVSAVAVACNSMPFTATWYHSGRSSSALLIASLLWLLDKCLQHESFIAHHKRLWLWRSQLMLPSARSRAHLHHHQQQQQPAAAVPEHRPGSRRWSQQLETQQLYTQQLQQQLMLQQQLQQQLVPGSSWGPSVGALGLLSFPFANQNASSMRVLRPPSAIPTSGSLPMPWGLMSAPHPRPASAAGPPVAGSAPAAGTSLLSPQPFLAKRPSLQEPPCQLRPHVSLQRTRSAPSRPHQPHPRPVSPSGSCPNAGLQPSPPPPAAASSTVHSAPPQEDDITNRLESLCLSVTQHALE